MKSPDVGRIRLALRDATMEDHRRVDALFTPYALDRREDYRAFLIAHARAVGAIESVALPDRPRLPLLAQDLDSLGVAMPAPLPFVAMATDGYRWGMLYALEGSRLGGAMLARQVGQGLPTAYLTAAHDKGEWKAFQAALECAAAKGGEGWLDDAVQGARSAFALFAQAGSPQVAAHG